jgi:hypothetical protein
MMPRNSVLGSLSVLLVMGISGACDHQSPIPPAIAPSPTAPSPGPSAPTLVTAQIEGRVLDADLEEPIPGAQVTLANVCYLGACTFKQPDSTTANEAGLFRLTATVPENWSAVVLKVTNPGYEPTEMYLGAGSALSAVLRVYRTITIRSGESVRLRVLDQGTCGFESIPCRRVFVQAGTREFVDLEVSAIDPSDQFGVMVEPIPFSLPPLPRQLTVAGGEVWVVRSAGSPGSGVATVVARPH